MSKLSEYQIAVTSTPTKQVNMLGSDEDPLSPVLASPTVHRSFDLNTMFSGGQDDNVEDYDEDDEDSISFELYEDKLIREKIIAQIKHEIGSQNIDKFDISKFLLDHYKYRDLSDMSNGLSSLIENIDDELIENVNENYLSFINLGKSIDGSFDLIHDIKIDLSDYLKNIRLSNEDIEKDLGTVDKIDTTRKKLNTLKNNARNIITVSEMIECFDKLCVNFSYDFNSIENIKQMTSLYFSIGKVFEKLNSLESNIDIIKPLNKKMNDLKLEFRSLVKDYLLDIKGLKNQNENFFEAFKVYQILRFTDRL